MLAAVAQARQLPSRRRRWGGPWARSWGPEAPAAFGGQAVTGASAVCPIGADAVRRREGRTVAAWCGHARLPSVGGMGGLVGLGVLAAAAVLVLTGRIKAVAA